jgi:hypothetical protein
MPLPMTQRDPGEPSPGTLRPMQLLPMKEIPRRPQEVLHLSCQGRRLPLGETNLQLEPPQAGYPPQMGRPP